MAGAIRRRTQSLEGAGPAGSLQIRSRALAKSVSAATVDTARSVAYHAALGWWKSTVEGHGASVHALAAQRYEGQILKLRPEVAIVAESLGGDLSALSVSTASFEIGRLYCSLLPLQYRAAHGVFYTPAPLVSRLLDAAEAAGHAWTAGRVIDPSCGGGAFLIEAASRMVKSLGAAEPAIVIASASARLRGWDLDPFAVWLAQLAVETTLLPQVIESGRRLSPITETRDSLADWRGHSGEYALVMGNPAFGKVKDNDAIRTRFRRSLYGHPNLYGLFMDLAVHLAAEAGGRIAYLTPTSYFGGQYFKALRRLLAEEAPPFSIDIVESRADIFEDVLQEVALSVFRRRANRVQARCSVIHVETSGLRIEASGSLVLPKHPEAAWLMPRKATDLAFIEKMLSMPARLSDWGYSVSTGPLVWNRKKAKLHWNYRNGCVPVIWAEAVGAPGKFRLKPQKPSHAPYYEPSGSGDSNLVTTPCVLIQRTTSKEQDRRLVSAFLPMTVIEAYGAVAVENHLNMVIAARRKPAVPMPALAAFYRSETADRVIRCINASVAVSASELEAMPLPPADAIVRAMASRNPEAALRRLYGIAE